MKLTKKNHRPGLQHVLEAITQSNWLQHDKLLKIWALFKTLLCLPCILFPLPFHSMLLLCVVSWFCFPYVKII